MKNLFIVAVTSLFLFSCNNAGKAPDVSAVKVDLQLQRFDKDLFSIDTNNINSSLDQLQNKYPHFFGDFLANILGIDNQTIQSGAAPATIKYFISSYKNLYDSSNAVFGNFEKQLGEIKKMLQYVKHYFPVYKTPAAVTTFVGPLDASFKTSFGVQGDILTPNTLGAGLQLHLGKNSTYYTSQQGLELYPEYISRRFEPDNIAINLAKNIVDDLYPDKDDDKPLVSSIVGNGKRLYLLQQFVPGTDEYKLIGYTKEQMEACYKNEARIWDLFIKNNYLQVTDKNTTKDYISESPKTQELGEAAPGNIGSFAGWQIVKKYMDKNPATTLQQLIAMDNEMLFEAAKYKP
ncbi:MAG: hypothetical protein QM791_15975 [Ferruginibacter sp.]